MRKTFTLGLCTLAMASGAPALAQDAFTGQIKAFASTYCPRDWMEARGQSLSINQYEELFALYYVTYGGDGNTNFSLPNLSGRFVAGDGVGPGLTLRAFSQPYGFYQTSLSTAQMPPHSHAFYASTDRADSPDPEGLVLGSFAGVRAYAEPSVSSQTQQMHPDSIAKTGGGAPIPIQDPFVAFTYCVNTDGIFPSRN